jgi:hypothetical protein
MSNIKDLVTQCHKCRTLGIDFDYERFENFNHSRRYKPDKVKFLWILESPPLSEPPRYFYRPALTQFDGLFREMMKVLGIPISNPKDESLKQFAGLGHFLIDAMKCPADKGNSSLKPTMLKNCSVILAKEIIDINPEKIIIVKADIYRSVFETVQALGMSDRVLNQSPIPFPGSGQQLRFRTQVEKLLKLNIDNKKEPPEKSISMTTLKSSILVHNITENDIDHNQLRITVANKFLFPAEKIGQPRVYKIILVFNGTPFTCTYRIGSLDGKSRSGVLKLGSQLSELLKPRTSDNITISLVSTGKYEIAK